MESTLPRSFAVVLKELQSTMSSNDDLAVNVVIVEDATVIVASNDSDGDMQAIVHSIAKSKRKHQKH